MTTTDLVKLLEGYYGPYERPVLKQMVTKYLDGFTSVQRAKLWTEIKLQFSTRWNTQPDIAVLEETVQKSEIGIKAVDGEVFNDGVRIGHYDSGRFIPDLAGLDRAKMQRYIDDYEAYQTPEKFIELREEQLAIPEVTE